jgi:hypothetical protein
MEKAHTSLRFHCAAKFPLGIFIEWDVFWPCHSLRSRFNRMMSGVLFFREGCIKNLIPYHNAALQFSVFPGELHYYCFPASRLSFFSKPSWVRVVRDYRNFFRPNHTSSCQLKSLRCVERKMKFVLSHSISGSYILWRPYFRVASSFLL